MASTKKYVSTTTDIRTFTSSAVSTRLAYVTITLAALGSLIFFSFTLTLFNNESLSRPNVVKTPILVLTDQVLKLQAKNYTQPSASNSRQITHLLAERKESLLNLMAQPDKALKSVFPKEVQETFADNDKQYLEETMPLSGTLQIGHADFGALEESITYYQLKKDDQWYHLHFEQEISDRQNQTAISIKEAIVLGKEVLVPQKDSRGEENVTFAESKVKGVAAATVTQKKNLVVLFKFADETRPEPMTVAQVKSVVFTASNSVNAYYQESTHGNFSFIGNLDSTGDVTGWYTIPSVTPVTPMDCYNYFDWVLEADQLAGADGYDSFNYDNVIFIMPLLPSGFSVCPWAGIAGAYFNLINGAPNYVNARVIAHELGHNYSLGHANSRRCYDASNNVVPLSNNCVHDEYGDPFDVMGSAVVTRQLNIQNKYVLGALDSANSTDGSAGGTFTLTPIEQASSGYQRLYLNRGTSSPLFIEYRQPYGVFDNFAPTDPAVNGLLIRLAGGLESSGTYLFDMTPQTPNDDMLDAALPVGQTFTDETYGYIITAVSAGSSGAVVQVQKTTPTCQYGTATATIDPASQIAEPGSTIDYTLTVTNHDTSACPTVVYNLNSSLPVGWTQTYLPLYLVLNPGETKTISVTVTIPSEATAGAYNLSESIFNLITNATELTENMTAIIYVPDMVSPETVDDLRSL
ncbi:MAG: NEW3 domain-containing protein [Patescibacteria group bacterium]